MAVRVAPLAVSVDKKSSSSSPLPVSSSMVKKHPAPLLAVIVDVKPAPSPVSSMNKQVKKEKPLVVLLVSLWALLNAAVFAGFSIATIIKNRTPCTKSTWWWRCVELTDAAAAEVSALVRGQLWCSAPQAAAAAAALALLLLTRRGRRSRLAIALAVVALEATAASHYMQRRVAGIFLTAVPGDAGVTVEDFLSFVVSLVDVVGFLGFILVGDGGEE